MNDSSQPKGFLGALFDISFEHFITGQLISVLYILAIIFVAIGTIGGVVGGMLKLLSDFWGGVFMIIFTPLLALVYLVIVRIGLELIIVIFKIAENTKNVAAAQQSLVEKE